jgi:hypothetical protein
VRENNSPAAFTQPAATGPADGAVDPDGTAPATDGTAPATDGAAAAADGAPEAAPGGLTPREALILEFEGRWWRTPGAKDQAIRTTFGLSSTRYYQALNRLLDSPAALAADPVLLGRLRRLRESRRGARGPAADTGYVQGAVGPATDDAGHGPAVRPAARRIADIPGSGTPGSGTPDSGTSAAGGPPGSEPAVTTGAHAARG